MKVRPYLPMLLDGFVADERPEPTNTFFTGKYTFTLNSTDLSNYVLPYYIRYAEMGTPKQIEDLGLAIEPIVGWRSWQIIRRTHDGWRLASCNQGDTWEPREAIEATCHRDENVYSFAAYSYSYHDASADLPLHDAPGDRCNCGVYAWKNVEQACPEDAARGVYGEVSLWGKVLLCELGYRAEFGYPKSLVLRGYAPKASRRIADELAEVYGIPVEVLV